VRRATAALCHILLLVLLTLIAPRAWAEGPAVTTAIVRVHEREVYVVRVPRAGQAPQDRARLAGQALEAVLEEGEDSEARVERQGATAVVFVGKSPILTLTEDDAAAAGDATLEVHAAGVATRVTEGLRTERKRSAIATTVFSFSLLVFSALIAFLLLRRVGEVGGKVRAWVQKNPDRIPALHLGKIEVVSKRAVRGVLSIALVVGHRIAQVAIAYGWVLVALSLFESTRAYTERLTGFVLTPLSALLGRVGSALPLLVVTGVAALALGVVVRFTGLFFGSIARGETKVGWLPLDLAEPTSVLARAGLVVVGLILAAPLITGSDEGALSRAGVAALVALGLACTPVLASAAAGVPQVFGRRMRPGDHVEIGGLSGRVRRVTLLEVELEDRFGCELRVPHLLLLVKTTRVLGHAELLTADVSVDPRASQTAAHDALMAAARTISSRAKVELLSLDHAGARYRVTCEAGAGSLAGAIADALAKEGIELGAASG
jgi:small-conductance mechanosensitive channel